MAVKFNPGQLEASIRNIAERASSNAARGLRRSAIKIRDLARDYAPEDTGTLENAIDYGTLTDARRRLSFVVYIDLDKAHPAGGSVGDYAWIMEQELHPHGRQKGKIHFDLDKSRAKATTGKKVGGRFLSRAIKEGSKMMLENARTEVSRTLSRSRLINMDYQRDTGGDE